MVLELATGFATISCVLLASGWYEQLATRSSGYEASELVMATVHQPADTMVDEFRARDAASAIEAQTADEHARAARGGRGLDGVGGDAGPAREHPGAGERCRGNARTARSAVGWTVYTSPAIAEVLGLRLVEGAFPRDLPTADLTLVTVITRCLRERLFPDDRSVVGRVVRAVDAPPARVVAVIENVVLRDPWNAHGSCVSIRFGWPPDERESRFLLRARPGQRAQVMAGLRAVLGPTTPDRLVAIEPFDPKDAHPTRMARGLVVNLGVFGAIVIVTALLGTLTVSSFLVYERTRSIGIRRALGAAPPDIVRYFLVETTILTGFGRGAGSGVHRGRVPGDAGAVSGGPSQPAGAGADGDPAVAGRDPGGAAPRPPGGAHPALDGCPQHLDRGRTAGVNDIRIVEANLDSPEHQRAVLELTDAYSRDPMGDGHPLSPEVREALIPGLQRHPTTLIFLAYDGTDAVGIATCFLGFSTFSARPLINIHDLGVLPAQRGRGIGRRLLAAIESKARALGCCKLTLEVLENNLRARGVYAAAGFAQATYTAEAGGALFLAKKL